jgi:hypothetical protein
VVRQSGNFDQMVDAPGDGIFPEIAVANGFCPGAGNCPAGAKIEWAQANKFW